MWRRLGPSPARSRRRGARWAGAEAGRDAFAQGRGSRLRGLPQRSHLAWHPKGVLTRPSSTPALPTCSVPMLGFRPAASARPPAGAAPPLAPAPTASQLAATRARSRRHGARCGAEWLRCASGHCGWFDDVRSSRPPDPLRIVSTHPRMHADLVACLVTSPPVHRGMDVCRQLLCSDLRALPGWRLYGCRQVDCMLPARHI